MKAKLTCRQAWEKLATAWAGPECHPTELGLCFAINALMKEGSIDYDVRNEMIDQMERFAPPTHAKHGPYRWACSWRHQDREGRAKFCAAMVRRLTKKAPGAR